MNKPVAKDFVSNAGMHWAMEDWAKTKAKKTLTVTVKFSDGPDCFIDTFERVKKEVSYKTPDGETYTVEVDTSKFVNPYMVGSEEMTVKEIKAAFVEWVKPREPVVVESIKWSYT